jgi:hypothetical protein
MSRFGFLILVRLGSGALDERTGRGIRETIRPMFTAGALGAEGISNYSSENAPRQNFASRDAILRPPLTLV